MRQDPHIPLSALLLTPIEFLQLNSFYTRAFFSAKMLEFCHRDRGLARRSESSLCISDACPAQTKYV